MRFTGCERNEWESGNVKKHYDQVYRFHAAAGIDMPEVPRMLGRGIKSCKNFSQSLEHISDRMKGYSEFAKIYGIEASLAVVDRTSYMLEELAEFMQAETIEDQADALIDLIYFAIGTFTLMGVNPEPLFNIVSRANLGKIMPDGTVLRNEQGKIQKPDGWHEQFAPEALIKEEIERQKQN